MKKAPITGVTGQRGSYPAEVLLSKDTWRMALCAGLPASTRNASSMFYPELRSDTRPGSPYAVSKVATHRHLSASAFSRNSTGNT